MDLVKFCERAPSQYADVLLYLAAQNYCKNLPADMRGQLFYALLNWKDCHKEVQNQCARLATSYEVCWYEKGKDGKQKGHRRTFDFSNSVDGPQHDARKFYAHLHSNPDVACAELRLNNNDFIPGRDGLGGIVLSFDRDPKMRSMYE